MRVVDLEELTTWHTEAWREVHAVVLGAGVSGFAVADTLTELGARVTVIDRGPDEQRAALLNVIGANLVI
ncbi:MAG TPA: NAD-binding protein, partial [Candidatus Agrococcus pullicola]|nr:NAD-binding protein [Candidatus Agrococcus pullicola]